ncbi:MAG: hypothetical protein HY513_02395 [Candidatus Aenigmarchaeota archaeon]|nr:hypothetical protein [Candidatus Aenigmarchaeota archaeon]
MKNSILTSKSKIEIMNMKLALLIAVLVIVLAVPAFSQLTIGGKTCSGNSVCESQTTCDSSGICSTTLLNCESCGTAVKACPDGSVATAPNICVGGVGQSECRPGVPVCRATGAQEATKVLPFAVFTKKGFVVNITPAERKAIAGTAVEYEINIENQNPIPLTLQIGRQVPKGWTSEGPASLNLGPKGKDRFVLTVSSNVSANDGTYAIALVFFNPELNIVSTITAKYTVASRGAPALKIEPRSKDGIPGETVFFTVTVSNNDPAEFDAASFLLQGSAPAEWTVTFNSSLLKIAPGQRASTLMAVKIPQNLTEGETVTISVNATSGKVSTEAFADVTISLCGNGVCDLNEACGVDCPAEQFFTCAFGNGRCEQEIDDGVEYSAVPNFVLTRFIVCSRNAAEADCLKAAECGFGKACLCTSDIASQCNVKCVDNKGVYYLYATGVSEGRSSFRSEANYSFTCPFVNLPEIIQTRNAFSNARDSYEKAKSALGESIKKAPTDEEKAKLQPCFDALGVIIGLSTDHVKLLDAVIKSPAVSNTTEARARTAEVRAEIETLFNTNCRGATGLLQIRRIIAPGGAEKGTSVVSTVDVRNIGDTTYFGSVQCDYVAPSQQRSSFESSCTEFPPNIIKSFNPVANATEAGLWKLQCKVTGSLNSNCSAAEIHDFDESTFNVSTREAFVVDVFGFCSATGITCEVRSNTQAACTQCFIGVSNAASGGSAVQCQKQSQDGTLSVFRCPSAAIGFAELTGKVFPSAQCVPVEPQEKSVSVLCEGCGDGLVSNNEQCEAPNTDNNQICSQNATTCDGKRFGQRDAAGFCTGACLCSEDQFTFSCQLGKCGATCSDGQTRNITITKPGGTCVALQQCGSSCEYQPVDCEPGSVCGNKICQAGETATNCPADCSAGSCGNGICDSNENNATCPTDCKTVAGKCEIKIASQSCSFVSSTNRYQVTLSGEWKGGDHAHSIVDDDPSQKFTGNFSTTHTMAGPGTKAIKVEVHNASDSLLCFNTSQIQCLPGGTTTGRLVDVVRQIPDATNNVVRTGAHIVNLQVAPYADISGFELREHTESGLTATNFVFFGNTSPVTVATAPVIESDKTFTQYLFTTNLRGSSALVNRNITIQYTLSALVEKTYTLYWKYTALGQEVSEQPRMLLNVVDCAQTFPVYAVGPTGGCLQYANSCKVPASWSIVSQCPEERDDRLPPVTQAEDGTWLIIILIVVLVIIVIVLVRYRDEIKQRLGMEEEETEENVELEEE